MTNLQSNEPSGAARQPGTLPQRLLDEAVRMEVRASYSSSPLRSGLFDTAALLREAARAVQGLDAPDGDSALRVTGWQLIAAERDRQQAVEGWTFDHDAGHTRGELTAAACCYIFNVAEQDLRPGPPHHGVPRAWPWSAEWWKPKDPIRNLARAGALIAAEIDRRLRAGR